MAVLPEGVEMVMPGDNVALTVELITPIAMEKELRFAIREGVVPWVQASSVMSSNNGEGFRHDNSEDQSLFKIL